jgi:cytochrome b involved in lipid metabolism
MKKMNVIIITLLAVLIFSITLFFIFRSTGKVADVLLTNETDRMISLQELALHDQESNCWVVYKGKVYDLTAWLPKHQGTAGAILPYCGNEGFEQAFIAKHGTTKANLFARVAVLMGDFKVAGNLN